MMNQSKFTMAVVASAFVCSQANALVAVPDTSITLQVVAGSSNCLAHVERGHGGWSHVSFLGAGGNLGITEIWNGSSWINPFGTFTDAVVVARVNQCLVQAGYPAGSSISNFQRTIGGAGNVFSSMQWLGMSFDFNGTSYKWGLDGVTNTVMYAEQVPPPPPNQAPSANAGVDQTVASEAVVTLDASGSSDPNVGQTLTYAWTQTGGPAVTLSSAVAAQPTFTAPTLVAGVADVPLTFSLIVTDNLGLFSTADAVTITVQAPAVVPMPAVPVPMLSPGMLGALSGLMALGAAGLGLRRRKD